MREQGFQVLRLSIDWCTLHESVKCAVSSKKAGSPCWRRVLSRWLKPQGQGSASDIEMSPPLTVTHIACVAGGEAVGEAVPSRSVATACRSCGCAACCAGLRRRTCTVIMRPLSELRLDLCCIKHSCTREAFVCGRPR